MGEIRARQTHLRELLVIRITAPLAGAMSPCEVPGTLMKSPAVYADILNFLFARAASSISLRFSEVQVILRG